MAERCMLLQSAGVEDGGVEDGGVEDGGEGGKLKATFCLTLSKH